MDTRAAFGGLIIFLLAGISNVVLTFLYTSRGFLTRAVLLFCIVVGIVLFIYGVFSNEHAVTAKQEKEEPEEEPEKSEKEEQEEETQETEEEPEEEAIVVEDDSALKETEKIISEVKRSMKKKSKSSK